MPTTYGYARVSTREQNEDRQLIALHEVGVTNGRIYIDKQSGKDFIRPQYKKLLRKLKKDDLLFIKSIDRLGRNYEEILEQWRILTKEKGIDIVVLDMPLLDTRRGKDLMGTFLSDIVLQVLSFVAENERTTIRQRQAEGIAAAQARGVRFGRPPKPLPDNFHQVYQRWRGGKITGLVAAKECQMPMATFRYRAEIYKKSQSVVREVDLQERVDFCKSTRYCYRLSLSQYFLKIKQIISINRENLRDYIPNSGFAKIYTLLEMQIFYIFRRKKNEEKTISDAIVAKHGGIHATNSSICGGGCTFRGRAAGQRIYH